MVAAGAAVGALLDPHRGDLVALLGDTTAPPVLLDALLARMRRSEPGRRLLRDRPAVDASTVDMEALRALPDTTFGRQYARFMDTYGFHADERSPVRFVDNPDHAFILQRYRQTHDFVHVLSGLPPTVLGEVSQKVLRCIVLQDRRSADYGLVVV